MKAINFVVAAGLLSVSNVVLAASETFTAEAPTTYEDGTTLDPAAELAFWTVTCDNGFSDSNEVTGLPLVLDAPTFPNGSFSCTATVTSIFGEESGPSNVVTGVSSPGRPNPPRNFSK